ncbi:MAG: hypothetical protein ACLFMX_02640 [Halobacteriales archaeon]
MREAYVQLRCPVCQKDWQGNPADLPAPDADFSCPDCGGTRSTTEFMRTARDLEIYKTFVE